MVLKNVVQSLFTLLLAVSLLHCLPVDYIANAEAALTKAALKKARELAKKTYCKKFKAKRKNKNKKCVIKAASLAPSHYRHLYNVVTNQREGNFYEGGSITTNQAICIVANNMSKLVFHTSNGSRSVSRSKDYYLPFCVGGSVQGDVLPMNHLPGTYPLTIDFYDSAGRWVGFSSTSFRVITDGSSSSSTSSVASSSSSSVAPVSTATPTRTPTSTPTQTPTAVPQIRSGVGINVEGVQVYGSSLPFKNLVLQSGGWSSPVTSDLTSFLDSDGWPVSLPGGQPLRASVVYDNPMYPAGRYMLRFQGSGTVVVTGDARNFSCSQMGVCEFDVTPTGIGLTVEVRSIQQPIRLIEVYEKRFDGTIASAPFHPNYLATLGPKPRSIRFMDWAAIVHANPETNSKFTGGVLPKISSASGNSVVLSAEGAPRAKDLKKAVFILRPTTGDNPRFLVTDYNPTTRTVTLNTQVTAAFAPNTPYEILSYRNREWSERPKLNQMPKLDSGIAIEYMIKLCNQLKASPWFSIPVAASDDYVQKMAQLVKSTLDPSLEIYLEYANEFWNFGYPGNTGFIFGQANQPSTGVGPTEFYALRSTQVFKIWNDVFGSAHLRAQRSSTDRLRRVIGVQTEYFATYDANRNGIIEQTEYEGPGPQMLKFGGQGLSASTANPYAANMITKDYADAIGVALYFNGVTETDLDSYIAGGVSADALINKMFAAVDHFINIRSGDSQSGVLTRWINYARAYGLDLQGYEGSLCLNLDAATPVSTSQVTATSQGNVIGLDKWRISNGGVNALPGRFVEIITGSSIGELRKIVSVVENGYDRVLVQLDAGFSSQIQKGSVYKLMTARHVAQHRLSMHPRMKDLYIYLLGSWRGLGKVNGVGAEVFNQFTNTGRWSWHYLSLVDRVDIDPNTYPKFRGYAEFQANDRLE